jgi:hypothetical protein
MRKTFVMRGKTASGSTEVLQFGKYKQGYAYRMTAFDIYPSSNIGLTNQELSATITAAKTFEDPSNPNFNNDGLIGTAVAMMTKGENAAVNDFTQASVVNDTYVITQNLILAVIDTVAGAPADVNWQCRFESVKMTGSEEAAVNYKQFAISDE